MQNTQVLAQCELKKVWCALQQAALPCQGSADNSEVALHKTPMENGTYELQ